MSAPLVVSFWMRALVTFVDTIYAALIGDSAVAAVGLTVPLEFLMIAVWVGLSTGLTSALSRAMGARAGRKIQQYLAISWRLVWWMAPVFCVVGIVLWWVAPRLGLDAAVGRSFQIYGTVLVAGSALSTFWSIPPDSLIKAHQDTRSTMWAGIWSNVINVGLNTLFLFGFHWGVFGIALSTVLGRFGGLAYALVQARRHEARRKAAGGEDTATEDPAPARTILALAIPSSLTFVLMALETALVNAILARTKDSTAAIAAYSIYYRIVLFALQPIIAMGVAMLPFAARRFGAQDVAGARNGLRQSTVAALVYSLGIVGPLMLWLGPWLSRQLAESEATMRYTTFALYTVPLSCASGALFLLCRPVFEAMNRGRPGLLMAVFRYAVLTGPMAWLGLEVAERAGFPAIYGLIIALLVVGLVSSVVFFWWVRAALAHLDRV
jgi:Na+-driven multidrug efflux pump